MAGYVVTVKTDPPHLHRAGCLLLHHSLAWQVWGVAYEISNEDWEGGVRDQLDHREKGGYSQHRARSR